MGRHWAIGLAAAAALALAGCGGGNPFAFAPPPEPVAPVVVVGGLVIAEDGTALMPAVQGVAADRGRQGVILRAEGLAPVQGFHTPELRPVGRGADGIEVLEFRARPPLEVEAVGAPATRILSVGRFYTNRQMTEIRGFRVVAGQNAGSVPAP
jgi:hypothetical protein